MTQNYHVVVAFRSTDRAPGRSYSHPPCADVPGRTSVPNRWNQGDMCILQFGMWRVFWYLWLPKKHIKNIVISTSKPFFGLSFWRLCILYVYIYTVYPYTETWAKLGIRPLHAHGQSTIYDPQAKPLNSAVFCESPEIGTKVAFLVSWFHFFREHHPGQGGVFSP